MIYRFKFASALVCHLHSITYCHLSVQCLWDILPILSSTFLYFSEEYQDDGQMYQWASFAKPLKFYTWHFWVMLIKFKLEIPVGLQKTLMNLIIMCIETNTMYCKYNYISGWYMSHGLYINSFSNNLNKTMDFMYLNISNVFCWNLMHLKMAYYAKFPFLFCIFMWVSTTLTNIPN